MQTHVDFLRAGAARLRRELADDRAPGAAGAGACIAQRVGGVWQPVLMVVRVGGRSLRHRLSQRVAETEGNLITITIMC